MYAKIEKIKILPNYIIETLFKTGELKTYDFKPLFKKYPTFLDLKDINIFKNATIEPGGYAISWGPSLDISATEIFNNGKNE